LDADPREVEQRSTKSILLVGRGDIRKEGVTKTHSWSSPRVVRQPGRSGRCLKKKLRTFGLLLEETDALLLEKDKAFGIFTEEHRV
jgi:hypothetical protein